LVLEALDVVALDADYQVSFPVGGLEIGTRGQHRTSCTTWPASSKSVATHNGWSRVYLTAVELAFGTEVDYAMLVKMFWE